MYTENDLCRSHVENAWATTIESQLPTLDNSKYKVSVSIIYNPAKDEYDINCDCDVIKSLYTNIKIPQRILNQNDLTDFYNYMGLLTENLIDKINGIKPKSDYIEIDGKKYYPEGE